MLAGGGYLKLQGLSIQDLDSREMTISIPDLKDICVYGLAPGKLILLRLYISSSAW